MRESERDCGSINESCIFFHTNSDKIERFIDDNKALMRRMYGDFEITNEYGPPTQQNRRRRRYLDDPDIFIPPGSLPADKIHDDNADHVEHGDSYFGKLRTKRQNSNTNNNNKNKNNQKPTFNRSGSPRPNNAPNPNDSSTGRYEFLTKLIHFSNLKFEPILIHFFNLTFEPLFFQS